MSDTVKLIIELPKEDYEFTKGAKTARYFPSEYYVKMILNGTLLDDVKAEIEDCSFNHYFEYGEYIGENPIQHRICMTDKVLEILSKYMKGGEENE